MAKKVVLTEEERVTAVVMGDFKDMEKRYENGIIPLNPTRFFEIDERVILGNLDEVYVREIYRDGLYYKLEAVNVKRDKNKPAANEIHIDEWHRLNKFKRNNSALVSFTKPDTCYIKQYTAPISSLLHKVYYWGVDFDVDYQRDHVWTLDDKIALIDSIFNNIDIGKFVFAENIHNDGKSYEIIDGKQRLTALCEFYEDRFKYKGYYYSELMFKDKHKFDGHSVVFGELENPTQEAKYETFIKLNTTGRPMLNEDVEKVKILLKNIETKI